jgi:Rod binding domain-containing protein
MVGRIEAGASAAECPDQRRLREAATGFEAQLLAQLLKAMREERGWMGTGEDQASASMLEIAEEHLAEVLAGAGGLGLRDLIVQGLRADACSERSGS